MGKLLLVINCDQIYGFGFLIEGSSGSGLSREL